MPTNLEYALFAANVYGNTTSVRSEQNTLPIPTGWEPIGTPVVLGDGFMARAYKNGSEIVISYAGTTDENMLDWITGNGPGGTAAFLAPQITDAAQFYLDIAKANPTVTDFKFTGHSLGGGLAGAMGVFFNKQAVTFDPAPFRLAATQAIADQIKAFLASAHPEWPLDTDLKAYSTVESRAGLHAPTLNAGSLTQPCRRTRRASVPARLRARGRGACTTRPISLQHLGLHANSVATANWLRRSGTATRHVCGLGWLGGEQYQDWNVHFTGLVARKSPWERANAACSKFNVRTL